MKVEIRKTVTGNCNCRNCGKDNQRKLQPYTVWHKADNENRGHNEPVCSLECARALAEVLKRAER